MLLFNLFKRSVIEQNSKNDRLSAKLNYKAPAHNLSKTDAIQILLKLARFYSKAIVEDKIEKPLYLKKLASIQKELAKNSDDIADTVVLKYMLDYVKHGLK